MKSILFMGLIISIVISLSAQADEIQFAQHEFRIKRYVDPQGRVWINPHNVFKSEPTIGSDDRTQAIWYSNGCAKPVVNDGGITILPSEPGQTNGIEGGLPSVAVEMPHHVFDLTKCDTRYSEAALACARLKSRLPTVREFYSLIRNFDHRTSKAIYFDESKNHTRFHLTEKGRLQANRALGFRTFNGFIWTSETISSRNSSVQDSAYYYDYDSGSVEEFKSRNAFASILCVYIK